MEIDDDYESFSPPHDSPSPSPNLRRLKRLKKSTIVPKGSPPAESVSPLLEGLPRVDFVMLEALESSDVGAFDDLAEPLSSQSSPFSEGSRGDVKVKELSAVFDDTRVVSNPKETKRSLEFDEDDDDGKEKELGFEDAPVNSDKKETKSALESDEKESGLNYGFDGARLSSGRKDTKRALEFDDEIHGSKVDERDGMEGETMELKKKKDGEKEVSEGETNEKKGKKKRRKGSDEDSKSKTSSSNKRREEKERKARLQQLHAESQRLLRETRGATFKPVQVVQKPISSVLEKIRQRKLEVSKKFLQSNNNDSVDEYDGCLREAETDHYKRADTEVADLSKPVKEGKVSSVLDVDPGSDDACIDGVSASEEKKDHDNVSSEMASGEEPTPAFRAPVDDTQELYDSQTSDSKEAKDELTCEPANSSQEEEMEPSWLTMKLKLDSAPDDISDEEEESDKENIDPDVHKETGTSSSPKGDPVKAFVDDEAEEEDDSDNDLMRFGDDEEEENDDDAEELKNMIATGYEEKPIDKEARNELHQKWLEEKDAAGTDDLLRRLNVAPKLMEASLLNEEEGEDDVELTDDGEEDVERPRVPRMDSRKAKEVIDQMFCDKDEDFLSSDDEEIEKRLVRQCLLDKAEEKGKLISPVEDEGSREVFGLIKKLNTVPETRKKAKPTSFFDTMLTGGNSNSSSKSSFLSRVSNHSVSAPRKQGSTVIRSFIFGRDDSNSRSSILISEDSLDTVVKENQTKKVTTKFSGSQARSSTQTARTAAEPPGDSGSLFEILKRSSVQASVHSHETVVNLSQSAFAAFKIPKKPIKVQGRV